MHRRNVSYRRALCLGNTAGREGEVMVIMRRVGFIGKKIRGEGEEVTSLVVVLRFIGR